MIEIYCDLNKRTKINNLPIWCKKIIKSNYENIKLTYTIKKTNKNIIIYFGDLITKEKIELMPNLRWIHFASAGTNRAQLKLIREKKIIVTNSPQAFVHSLASLALAHIFSFSRGIHFSNNLLQYLKYVILIEKVGTMTFRLNKQNYQFFYEKLIVRHFFLKF